MISFLKQIWLVASREYLTTVKTRSFRLTVLSVPLMIIVMTVAQSRMKPPQGAAYIVSDQTGQYAQIIDHSVEAPYARAVLIRLSEYVQRWHLAAYAPGAVWNGGRRWFSDAEVTAFDASGGAKAALIKLKPHIPADAPAFDAPWRPFYTVATPSDVSHQSDPASFGSAIQPYLHKDITTSDGPRPLAAAIFIPKTFGPADPRLYIWTNQRPSDALLDTVRGELTGILRVQALTMDGLTPAQVKQIVTLQPNLVVTAPPPGQGHDGVFVHSLLPMALTYLLFFSIFTAGMKMLMGVVEERSNKLLESILACISPRALMYGKLLGAVSVGLTVVAVWSGCAVLAAYKFQGQLADFLLPALSALDSPWVGVGLVIYFVCGFIMTAMILLAIGSVSNSMQDTQGYLQPVLMLIILPYTLMLISMLRDPNALLPRIMSWIPFYTPYAMLARLGTGVPLYEVIGTTVLMFAFMVVELIWLGRIFQTNLLNTGQPPKLLQMFKRAR